MRERMEIKERGKKEIIKEKDKEPDSLREIMANKFD